MAGCGGGPQPDSGGLTSADRSTAQAAMDALDGSNIPLQLLAISTGAQETPAACRVHLVASNPTTFKLYLFWIPYLGGEDYTWLNMTITNDPNRDTFSLGVAHPVLPSGQLSTNGRSIVPFTVDTALLSSYGPQQARKSRELLIAHAGNAFSKPAASCQVLMNGDLRLLANAAPAPH
jgi:hypothetical protein